MRSHRIGVAAVAAAVAGATVGVMPVLAQDSSYGEFALVPTSGAVGDTITMTGENATECPEFTQIQLGMTTKDGEYRRALNNGEAVENDGGTIEVPFEIPETLPTSYVSDETHTVEPGEYDIYLDCVGQWTYANLTLTVVEASDFDPPAEAPEGDGPLATSASSVLPGAQLEVAGGGFVAGEDVPVVLYSSPVVLATATADGGGAISTTVTIPDSTEAGGHEIAAFGSEQVLTSALEVLPDGVSRVAGDDRIATAVEVSRNAFAAGAKTVVVASAATFPDALAGATLAGLYGVPVLLTGQAELDPRTAGEIDRLGATTAVMLGGPLALSAEVADDLDGQVDSVERIAGEDRYETAAAIADAAVDLDADTSVVYLVSGENFPDAVAISATAAATGRPLLLTRPDVLPDATATALESLAPDQVVVVGGPVAVSDPVAQAAGQAAGGATLSRLHGPDRYATAVAVAEHALTEGLTLESLWVATGQQFPDALSAGPAAAATGSALLLVGTDSLADVTTTFVADEACQIDQLLVVGGPVAVATTTLMALSEAASC